MYVFADRDFITLGDLFDAGDNHRHILSYRSLLPNTAGGNNHLAGYASQTDENQIGPLSLGTLYSIWFIFGYRYPVASAISSLSMPLRVSWTSSTTRMIRFGLSFLSIQPPGRSVSRLLGPTAQARTR